MHDYAIAVPSHRRAKLFAEKTLNYLRMCGVDDGEIDIYVSDKQDVEEYKYPSVVWTGAKNVAEKFNFIHGHYAPGTRVVVLEDDVELVDKNGPMYAFDDLVQRAFDEVGAGGIWGIAPHSNGFYFSGKVTRTLKLVVAHCFGFVSTNAPELEVTQLGKSDYERTCRYFTTYGEVLRMDMVGVKTTSYVQEGGMQSQHSRDERAVFERAACDYLVQRYPHLLRHNTKKKSLFAELSFRPCKYSVAELQNVQDVIDKCLGYTT